MNTDDVRIMLTLLKSIDDSLKKLVASSGVNHYFVMEGKAPKKNKHKPPAPSYMDK